MMIWGEDMTGLAFTIIAILAASLIGMSGYAELRQYREQRRRDELSAAKRKANDEWLQQQFAAGPLCEEEFSKVEKEWHAMCDEAKAIRDGVKL